MGDEVARIAAETIDPLTAPVEEDFSHFLPKSAVLIVELDEVRPGDAPGTRGVEGAVVVPDKPFRVVREELGAPAGVVDRDVDEEAAPPSVDGVGEFPELLERSGALVEFGEGGVDVIKIERSKGAAITAHAGVGSGDGERGEEQDDAEAHFPDDVVEA